MLISTTISMAVPHLEGSRGSAHPDPKIKGRPDTWLCRLQFGLKMRRRPRTLGPLLYIRLCTFLNAQTQQFDILQNSPYFSVFKYARAVKQKVWNEAENKERNWGES